jgi:hypothetical protein
MGADVHAMDQMLVLKNEARLYACSIPVFEIKTAYAPTDSHYLTPTPEPLCRLRDAATLLALHARLA